MQYAKYKIKITEKYITKTYYKNIVRKIIKKFYYIYRKVKVRMIPITLRSTLFYDLNPNCKFLYGIEKKEKYIAELKRLYLLDSTIRTANKICSHEFNLLGLENEYLGEKLPWNEDFKTGFRWNNRFYKDIKIVDLSNNADVKVPWELSRFQHIFTLGKAYWITNDEKYALEFKVELEDWIAKNPVEMSVNWTCTMDVAIRVVNLICAYFFFQKSSSIDYKFWAEFKKSLYLHGRFIYKNLENEAKHNNNHYLSDLAGLIWLGIYFGEFFIEDKEKKNNPKEWLRFGLFEFEKEMNKEVNEDGTDYESSTSYHILVTEIFLITTILCNRNNINFSKEYMQKLEKMCGFIMDITKPNGLCPLIGDSDDGRFIILSNYCNCSMRDFRHVLVIAGEYFNRDDFRILGKDYLEDTLWTIGHYKKIDEKLELSSKAYEKGGYYILRNNVFFCLIRCGELSCRGDGGHSHNDQLSIDLNVDGEDFIIDPGTYLYTADSKMRNLYRSTKMHNTLYIDGYEQNAFNEYDLFYMKEQTFSKCKLFTNKTFCGEHYGYKKKCGVIHKRTINLMNDKLIINDELIGDTIDSNVYIDFIIDNGVEIKEKNNGIELNKKGKKLFLEFNNEYLIEEGFVSYGYGQKLNNKKIAIKMRNMNSAIRINYI